MMKNSHMSASTVDSNSTHRFPYIWNLSDLKKVKKNGKSVFSFFSCGGGSSMGYKLAGFDVIGNCEIDTVINELYVQNNHPEFNYSMDIRKFVEIPDSELPEELFNLDILDGSPPCSTFSMAGEREDAWGKKKTFREGQAEQILDDLFFWYIKAVKKLKPKIFVAENVKGLILGNAKGYVNQIIREMDLAGYKTQIFLLNAASMGVPQRRERVFFIGFRKDLKLGELKLKFTEAPIRYQEFMDDDIIELNKDTAMYQRWRCRKRSDKSIGDTVKRTEGGKISGFTQSYIRGKEVARTLTAGSRPLRFDKPGFITDKDVITIQSFPQDYDFCGQDPCYVCGMSVPPVMMANIATEVYDQWLKE